MFDYDLSTIVMEGKELVRTWILNVVKVIYS